MKQFVYVLTNEDTHNILGIYTSPISAMNALWSVAVSCTIEGVVEEYVGTQYTVFNPVSHKRNIYYIEKIELNEKI